MLLKIGFLVLLPLCEAFCSNFYLITATYRPMMSFGRTGIGGKVVLRCKPGWWGNGSATCIAKNIWKRNITCAAVCEELPENVCFVKNGDDYKVYNTSVGATMPTRCCGAGGIVVNKTCQSNRTWSGKPLPCEPEGAEEEGSDTLSPGAIAGIVCGLVAFIFVIALLKWYFIFRNNRDMQ